MVSRATSPGPEEVRARGSRRRFPWRTTTRKGITDHAFWHLPRVWVVGREPRNAPRLDAREKNGGNSAGYGKFNEFQQAKIGVEIDLISSDSGPKHSVFLGHLAQSRA